MSAVTLKSLLETVRNDTLDKWSLLELNTSLETIINLCQIMEVTGACFFLNLSFCILKWPLFNSCFGCEVYSW